MKKRKEMSLRSRIILRILETFLWIYSIITLPIYLLFTNPWRMRQLTRMKRAESLSGFPEGPYANTYQQMTSDNKVFFSGLTSMADIFNKAVNKYRDRNMQGTREVLGDEMEPQANGKLFKKLILGDYKWQTYEQVSKRVANFGRGLRDIGQEPLQNIVLFGETRAEWLMACIACFQHNIPVVTLYATLGDEALVYGINETEATYVITSTELLPKLLRLLKQCPKVKHIVYMDQGKAAKLTGVPENVQVSQFSVLEKKGQTITAGSKDTPPTLDDTAIIMYTSGSTATPKGVIFTHENIIAALTGLSCMAEINSDDLYLAFLPLAHVLELQAEFLCMISGVPIAYSSPNTFSNQSSMVKKGCKGDAVVARPTFMCCVPLVLDRLYKGVIDAVKEKGKITGAIFMMAYKYKLRWCKWGYETPLTNKFVFSKFRSMMGGRVRILVTGGAPLSPETQDFIRVCLCCPLLQGYGLTETCATACCSDVDDRSTGRVGAPFLNARVLLEDWPEGNYHVSDKPYPRGEMIIGGKNISKGYYKMAEKTQEDFFVKDGLRFMRTGDIGEVLPNGTFRIIDRKKDLVKLQFGEYVSLGKVEAEYKSLDVVENICVYGDSLQTVLVALVMPSKKHLVTLAKQLNKSEDEDWESLCEDPDVTAKVRTLMLDHGKTCNLNKMETPAEVRLVPDIWTPDSGEVTAAFKLKRKAIQDKYQHLIDEMYARK